MEQIAPYGWISEERRPAATEEFMRDWKYGETEWKHFYDSIVEEFSHNIWPTYHRETGKWKGEASKFAKNVSISEVRLMFQAFQATNNLRRLPDNSRFDSTLNVRRDHLWHFKAEDRVRDVSGFSEFERLAALSPFSSIIFYQDYFERKSIEGRFDEMNQRKIRGLFRMKLDFQRPRPQQIAYQFFPDEEFKFHNSGPNTHTGLHPSLPSGHCLQGLIVMCGIIEELTKDARDNLDADTIEALKQYAVDYGDRRVIAGVHYPTDNIASWIISLKLIPKIFDVEVNKKINLLDFVKSAITKSIVFNHIKNNYKNHEHLDRIFQYFGRNYMKELLDEENTALKL